VAKGALYHHFQSKDDLLYEVYRELVDRQLAGLAAILARELAPADTLRAIVLDMVETTAARAAEAKVFFREGHRLTDANQQRVRAARRQIHDAVTELIRSGQRDGRFAEVASPEMVTFTLFGVINELPVWYSPDGPKSPSELAAELAELVLAALRPVVADRVATDRVVADREVADPGPAEPVADPVRTDPVRTDPVRTEPVRTDPRRRR
jgi:AcrR family transcriptional regulator